MAKSTRTKSANRKALDQAREQRLAHLKHAGACEECLYVGGAISQEASWIRGAASAAATLGRVLAPARKDAIKLAPGERDGLVSAMQRLAEAIGVRADFILGETPRGEARSDQ